MRRVGILVALACCLVLESGLGLKAADEPSFTRQKDVVYGYKYGTALTMDVFTPKNANGAAVIWVVSGGWFSTQEAIDPTVYREFLNRGYTVFTVVHGSQPRYAIPAILQDMHRAVRYIRYNASDYHIDPNRIGITGGSAGGHLSLMQGTAGDKGDPRAKDPIDRTSSRVQAVACFFPPTDFLNFGKEGYELNLQTIPNPFKPAFDFQEQDRDTHLFERVTDEGKYRAILRQVSPITHVGADSAPTLIIHGDADKLVPLQQSEEIIARFKDVGVPAELIVRKGAGHGGPEFAHDIPVIADWFDKYLKKDTGDRNGK